MSVPESAIPSAAETLISRINILPPLPAVAIKIIDKLGDEYIDGNEIADIVEQDPAIAGKLIGMANSAFFGLTVPTADMRDVVNRVLGADSVRTLAFALATQQAFDTKQCSAFDAEFFWRHSLRAATYSKRLADSMEQLVPEIRDMAFVTGLCHALGLLVLVVLEPGKLNQLLEKQETPMFTELATSVERDFSTSIEQLTSALAQHWQMPDTICKVYEEQALRVTDLSTATSIFQAAFEMAKLDEEKSDTGEHDIALRDRIVERTAVYLQVDSTQIEHALSLSTTEMHRVEKNAAALSGA
ncbi:MAG: HDOD domain-containing protein [Woeseiaceae bacterium]